LAKWVSIQQVKNKLKPKADELGDSEISRAIETGEFKTETFLLACERKEPYSGKDFNFACQHALVSSCIFLLSSLPISPADMRTLREMLISELQDLEQGFIRRIYKTTVQIRGVLKRIPVGHEEFYEEELEN